MAAKDAKEKAREARIKELERALKDERIGVLGIAIAFLRESTAPHALARRLEVMAHNAVDNPKVRAGTRTALVEGNKLVQRALAIELEKPQPLFEPDLGPANPAQVAEAVERSDAGAGQASMDLSGGDDAASSALDERQRTLDRVYEAIVALLHEHGAMTDAEIQARYAARADFLPQSAGALRARRTELTRRRRLVASKDKRDGAMIWDLLERSE